MKMYQVTYKANTGFSHEHRAIIVNATNSTIAWEKVTEYVGRNDLVCVECSVIDSGMYIVD